MNRINVIFLFVLSLLATGCMSYDKSVYLGGGKPVESGDGRGLYEYRVMPKDELTITVSTSDPEVSAPFYRKIGQVKGQSNQGQGLNNAKLLDYLVDNNGNIDFPVLGMVKVGGLTTRECEALIRSKLQAHLSETPTVTVRVSNFKVSVLGEVKSPGVFNVDQEKISVIEALARAGDLTIYGRRENVLLIREDSTGLKTTHRLNLNDANLINSPYYYLQQNDYIYVEPNKVQAQNSAIGSSVTIWFSVLSVVTSVASLVVNVVK